jgi:putative membrane protein
MRQFLAFLAVSAIAFGCRHEKPKQGPPPFDRSTFITSTLQASLSNIDLGAMAAHRGRLPVTRQLAAVLHREQSQLLDALTALAKRRNITVPTAVDEKKRALKDNLAILPGQIFDRAYALAMLQDFNAMASSFQRASSSGDRDLEAFANEWRPIVAAEQRSAAALLNQLGGSPFGFVP